MCAKFGLPCIIYMGAKDMERQALNVFRMRLLGAEVRPRPPPRRAGRRAGGRFMPRARRGRCAR